MVTVIMLLVPENSNLIKYVKWITALCVVIVLISPILNINGKLNINDYTEEEKTIDESTTEIIINEFKNRVEKTVSEMIAERFNIKCKNVTLDLNTNDIENIYIDKITVGLDTSSKFLKSDISGYLCEKLLCRVEFYD